MIESQTQKLSPSCLYPPLEHNLKTLNCKRGTQHTMITIMKAYNTLLVLIIQLKNLDRDVGDKAI